MDPTREMAVIDRAVLKIDSSTQTLRLSQQVFVVVDIYRNAVEGFEDASSRRREEQQLAKTRV